MRNLIFISLFLLNLLTYGQVASTYTFSQPVGSYSAIAGTTLGTINDDDEIFMGSGGGAFTQTDVGYPIGFTFSYNGSNYTRFGVCNNGYIELGNNAPNFTMNCSGYYNDMSGTGNGNIIGAFVNDLQGQTGSSLQYLTAGSSPNRTLTVQFNGFRLYGCTSDILNFQIILYETTNVIDIVYGSFTFGTGQASWETTSMVGLYGTTNADYFLRSTSWGASTNGTFNSDNIAYNGSSIPVNNAIFRYTPVSALPIELESFDGYLKNGKITLKWVTATETNNNYFTIEKSMDAMGWSKVGTINGAGTSSSKITYDFIDDNPFNGINYYRLIQTDFDGKNKTFKTIAINNTVVPKTVINIVNMLGQPITPDYDGTQIIRYSDGSILKKLTIK